MYKVILPNFEGPLDLLLYFIKRDEVNIYDIPISRITEEFLSYIRLIQFFDLELAGEFILMASSLMYIKSQMLLPRLHDEEGNEIEDPRKHLVQKLLEYKQFKEAATSLGDMYEDNKYAYYRQMFDPDQELAESYGIYTNATLFDLIGAFQKAIGRNSVKEQVHEIGIFTISVEDKRKEIISNLKLTKRTSFFRLTNSLVRIEVIVTFLAILELIKLNEIYIKQGDIFGDITIGLMPTLN